MWLASIATEIGPTEAEAAWRADSSPDAISTKPVSVAPTSETLKRQVPTYENKWIVTIRHPHMYKSQSRKLSGENGLSAQQ